MFSSLRASVPGLSFVDEEVVSSGGSRLYVTRPSRRKGRGSLDPALQLKRHTAMLKALQRETLPLSELAVYIDPLDGSTDASGHAELMTVNACITRCSRPIAGIIYAPKAQRIYWTRPGAGVNVHFSVETAFTAERGVSSEWETGSSGPCCVPTGSTGAGARTMHGGQQVPVSTDKPPARRKAARPHPKATSQESS
jgi:3'-phosphoadenosine 5'-phosphosulfate (PAPS) 3'-phosphatase